MKNFLSDIKCYWRIIIKRVRFKLYVLHAVLFRGKSVRYEKSEPIEVAGYNGKRAMMTMVHVKLVDRRKLS